jgi:TolB-like protein/Tfp pilus assembly protein PilF
LADIFLSYNREDQSVARAFAQGFEAAGYSVWWDTNLRAGEAYDEVTSQALQGAKAVVVLWSQKSVVSRWVRAEALAGQKNNRLVPCMIEACERPIMFELTHTAELHSWQGDTSDPRWIAYLGDVGSFVDRPLISAPAPSIASTALRTPSRSQNRRTLLVSGSVAVFGLGGIGVWAWRNAFYGTGGTSQGDNSVVVLPFVTIGTDQSQSFFADGLSAEVRGELASNPQLRVVAQTSSEQFKTSTISAQGMAKKLGVAFLLDGNVRKSEQKARIIAELIDAKSGLSIWGQTFDRPLDDIFAVQSEIAGAVVDALLSKLPAPSAKAKGPFDQAGQHKGGTRVVAAFESFLRGRALFEAGLSAQTDRDALTAFDAALARDPKYAAAHAFRARALAVIASQSGNPELIRANRQQAVLAARKAVELAPEFADGYSALGFVLFTNNLDARSAKPAFDKSFQYGSGDGDVLTGFAMFCGRTGRKDEAATTIEKAIERDGLNPIVFRCAGQIAAMARNFDAAIGQYQRALTLNPKATTTNALMGMAYFHAGRLAQARAALSKEPNAMFALPGLAIMDRQQGNAHVANQTLAKLVADFGDSALYQQAQVHAGWGDKEAALSTLERAYVIGDSGLAALFTDPIFDHIKSENRFLQLLKTIGFL